MTTYLILQKQHDDTWKVVGSEDARSDTAAIRQNDSEYSGDHGVYVAVPARSWRLRTVKAEQQTKITVT